MGRTKPSRAPRPEEKRRKKNDGRPPDTVKELLLHPKKKKKPTAKGKPPKKTPKKPGLGPPAYRWSDNSCWLDAPLQTLYMAITRNFDEFKTVCEPLDPDVALGALFAIFRDRFDEDFEEKNTSAILESQRDSLRIFLKKKKIIKTINGPESAVVCSKTIDLQCISYHLHRVGYLGLLALNTTQNTRVRVDIL